MTDPKRAFVTGTPIKHSKSPRVHSYWLQKYGLEGRYEAVETDETSLQDLFAAVRTGEWQGGNITLPHKQLAFELCDQLTDTARKIGAVNTIWQQDRQIFGDNTDGYGFLANLDDQVPEWDLHKNVAIVLGAGGAARAILNALVEKGFEKIYLLNRTLARAAELADQIDGPIEAQPLDKFNELAVSADFVVNTSSIGMNGTRFEHLHVDKLPSTALVTDIVYTPLMTPLLHEAQEHGLHVATGLGMLLHQAVPGFERWFGKTPDVDRDLFLYIQGEVENG